MASTITCSCCGKVRPESAYYKSISPFYQHYGKYPVCKHCIWKHEESTNDYEVVKDILRSMDKPYLIELWKSSELEAMNEKSNAFKKYMKNVSLPQYSDLNWSHSVFEYISDNNEEEINKSDIAEIVDYFGKGFTTDEYIKLSNERDSWYNTYDINSKALDELVKQICLTSVELSRARSQNQPTDKLLKTYQDLLGSANLKPMQESGANALEQESFGTLILKYEKEKPIPKPNPKWKDVDSIKKYMTAFFTGHLMKMLGKENPEVSKVYNEEFDKLTVKYDFEESGDDDGRV